MNNGKIDRTGKAFRGKSQLKNKINNFIADTFDEKSKIKTYSKNHMIVLNNKNNNFKNNIINENIYELEENKKKFFCENQKFELNKSRPPTQNMIKRNSTPFAPVNKADKNFYSANDAKIQDLIDSKKMEKESNFYKFNRITNPKQINDLIPFNDVYKKNKQMIYLSANIKNKKVKVNGQDINHKFFLNLNDYDIFDFKKKPLTADYTQKKVGLQKGQNQLILEKLKQKYMLENEKKKMNNNSNLPNNKKNSITDNKIREIYTPDVPRTNMNINNNNERKNKTSENFFKAPLNQMNNNIINNKFDQNNKKLEKDSSLKNFQNRDDFINYSNLKKEEKKTSCLKIFKIQNEINNKKNSEQASNIIEKNTDENSDDCKFNDISFSKGKVNNETSHDKKDLNVYFENNHDKFKIKEQYENNKNTSDAIKNKNIIIEENKLQKHKSFNEFSSHSFTMKEENKSLKKNFSQKNLQKSLNDKNVMTDNSNNLDKFLNKNLGDPKISKTKYQNKVDAFNEKAENIQGELKDQFKESIENFDYKDQNMCKKNILNNYNIHEVNKFNNKSKITNQDFYSNNLDNQNDLKIKKLTSSDKSLFEYKQDDILILKQLDKNLSLEINDTDGNIKILESRKNKYNFNIIEDKIEHVNFNKKSANNNLMNFNSLNSRLKSCKEKTKENLNLNYDSAKNESISPSRKDKEKKLIFVKSNESITLNKLNELSFANENNLGFSNKNFLKEQNSIASNRSSLNTDNKSLFNRKSVETIKNVNRNEDEYNKHFLRNCEIENGIDNNEECDKNNNVFDLLNRNQKENNNYSKHTFRNGDESDYKIDLETSKIFNDLKINSIEDDILNNDEFFKSEESQRFAFKKFKNEEGNLNINFREKEDIKIESEEFYNKNNLFLSNNNNYKNNVNHKFKNKIEVRENEEKNNVFFNKTNNNFSKFNNLNNNDNNNLKGNNIQINPKSHIINNNKNTSNHNMNCHNYSSVQTNKNYDYNSNSNRPPSFKVEEISNIMKRVLENNKKEAAAKSREFLNNYPQNYFNLAKTQTVFFAGASQGSRTERPSTDHRKTRPNFDTINFLEINLFDQLAWKKHEEIWDILKNNKNENKEDSENPIDKNNEETKNANKAKKNKVINLNVDLKNSNKYSQLIEKEKCLIPPNDEEVLISAYYKIYNINGKFIIDDNLQFPKEEINKWKNAYKKTVMRWHPDKLTHFIESLDLKDEYNKNSIIKKAGVIIYHMNKNLKNIVEILKNISIKQENRRTGNNN